GAVDAIQPQGTQVKVTMTVNSGVAVPADAKAVVVAASVVSDRYVQLTPAYTGGPQLADNAVIPGSRTPVPVEGDQIYTSLNRFAQALGPNGLNKNGALSELVKTGAANLTGNGANLHAMITQFGALSKTLGDNSGNLFATITYLQQFTSMLKANDGQVRLAQQQLADVSGFLASDRQDLGAALNELATALGQVQGFIASNRSLLKSNVAKLAAITKILADERASLSEAVNTIPLAVDNVVNAYDSVNRTLDGRGNLNELSMGPGAHDLAAITPGGTGAGSAGPAAAVPLARGGCAGGAAAATARRGLVRHARGRAGGRPLMIFAAKRSALGTRSPLRARVPVLAAGVTAVAVCAAGCGSGGFNGIYSL